MDPNATLIQLLLALADDDREAALDSFTNLTGWLDQGGFAPTDPRIPGAYDWDDRVDALVADLCASNVPEAIREFSDLLGLDPAELS